MTHSNSRPVLLLALTPRGWGETTFAAYAGRDLLQTGYQARVLTCDTTAAVFQGSGLAVDIIPEVAMPLLGLMMDEIVETNDPCAIILCDIVTSVRMFERAGLGADAIFAYDVPVAGVDTWNSAVAGRSADLFGREALDADAMLDEIPRRLMPVPFLAPDVGPGACRFLQHCPSLPRRVRRHVRRELCIADDDKLVLLCTSSWQHGPYENPHGNRLAHVVPKLCAEYLQALGPRVHLVHIGPARYDGLCLAPARYHWLPPQPAQIFDTLLASTDLVLSLNISSVSTIRAAISGLPVLALSNSCEATSREELEDFLGERPHPLVERHADSLLPIYPFALWPLGFMSYLAPSLEGNPIFQAVRTEELLAAGSVIHTVHELLFSTTAAEALRHSQDTYKKLLERLPSPAAAFASLWSGEIA